MWKVTLVFLAALAFGYAAAPISMGSAGAEASQVVATAPPSAGLVVPLPPPPPPPVPLEVRRAFAAPVVLADAPAPTPVIEPLPDPLNDPRSFIDGLKALRRSGGLWVALGLAVAAIGGAFRVRMLPRPGEPEPDPSSWHARSLALLGVVVMIGAAVADLALGVGGIVGFLTVVISAGALVWRAFNPPKGAAIIAKAVKAAELAREGGAA